MLDEKTIEELHSYYDRLPGGICLVKADDSEEILLANAELLNYYQCANWQEFKELTGGTYRGMVEASDYIPLKDIVRVKGQPEANYAYFQFPYRTREGHFNKGNALLIRTTQKGLGDIWSINVMKSKYSRAPGETENITGLLGGTAFYKRVNEHIQMEKIDGTGGLYCSVYFNLTNFKLYNSNYGIEQGDELLRKVADVLRAHFPYSIIAHLNADNFALVAPRDGVIEQVEAVCREVDEMIDNFSITLKAGVFFRDPDNPSEYTANSAFDMAKIACDSIKGDASRSWATYTETMGKNLAARAYVLENFDRALRNGYIKIFYQPVVRTLTGKLCGMEALARWEDPERGRLTPDMFVPVLEDAKLIYKLDSYVVEQVGKRLHTMEDSGMPVLPISVNLSSADFDQVDPLDVVERVVRKYRLPRSYIRIEITESALVKNGKKLQREIDRFRKAGYQCWMDDFGSGYSSFNVLQNFHFDELKIDMAFLRNFNDQSRKIIKSIVLMAKSLGVHTLAEGAETQEQVDFLRSVGCEKIQGYFYGRPMKYDDLRVHCRDKNLREETRQEEFAYDKLGLINVLTGAPVALCAVNDKSMRILYENDAYKKVLEDVSVSDLRQANANLAADDLPMHKKFRTFVDKAVDSMKKESMTYVDNGKYLRVNMEIVARTNQISVGRLALYNITFDDKFKETKRYDEIFRNAILFYDGIYYVHMDTGVLEVLETINPLLKAGDRIPYARQLIACYAARFIHRDDQERFMQYADAKRLYEIAKASKRSEANNVFRVKQKDGNYRWKEFDAIVLYKSQSKDLLLCLRDATMERLREREEKVPEFFESFGYVPRNETRDYNQQNSQIFINNALQSFLDFSGIKFFWKDKNRRFKGASNAFLNYYGLKLEDILGKTDEDMGWHINEGPYKDDEWAVLRHGRVKRHVIGHCIVKGVLHTIAASKFPIYDGNEIVGLAGYFNDVDKKLWRQEQQVKIGLTDPDTGLFGFRGMMMTGLQYADNYRLHGEDFCAIMLDVPDFDATVRMYGPQIRKKLLKRIQKALDTFDVQKRALGHIGEGGNFLCFVKGQDAKSIHKYLIQLAKNIHEITKIDGYDCTLYLRYSTAWCSESKNLDGMLHLLMERLNDQKL